MSSSEQVLHILDDSSDKEKSPPKSSEITVPFSYAPSHDGRDENILILLHGLGDNSHPFFKLGCQFKFPQTAILALCGPLRIPYLEEDAFQWYPSFDHLGELIEHPNPTAGIEAVTKTLEHLTNGCGWHSRQVHLFGYAQGGTVALESGLNWSERLGSIVSVNGPLISYPSTSKQRDTPVLLAHRPTEDNLGLQTFVALKKGFLKVTESRFSGGSAMPGSRQHWEPIMKFWSEHLMRRQEKGVYEIFG